MNSLTDPNPSSHVSRIPMSRSVASSAADRSLIPVLEARDVSIHFPGHDLSGNPVTIRAVDGVSLALFPGQISALVGESGSGKTTIARLFALINKPTSGKILYNGQQVVVKGARSEREYYRNVQLIYQDPFNSLNGLKRVKVILSRVIRIHYPRLSKQQVAERVEEALRKVNMAPPSRYLDRYPPDLSGGQRQRIAIARALAVGPSVLLADEPTSMLDASIRLDILNLLKDLCQSEDIAILYITHDIASARYLSDRVNIMYGGKIVESGPTEEIIAKPVHPYTKLLLSAAPDPARYKGSGRRAHESIRNAQPVDNTIEVVGCRFADRCPLARQICRTEGVPTFINQSQDRLVHCWQAEEDDCFEPSPNNIR